MMRMFVALVPPPEVLEELRASTEGLSGASPSTVRWTRPEQWHVTLAFLGEVHDPTRAALADRLGRVAAVVAPFTLSVASAGRFGDRVLWAGVSGDTAALHGVAASVRAAAAELRLATDDRPYHPHLTLALTSGDGDLGGTVGTLADFQSSLWTVDELCLVRTIRGAGPGGAPRYETVATWPMRGA